LIPLHPLRPQITPPIPYGIPVEVSVSAGIAPGVAYLDTRSEFPRFHPLALFLDWSNALVLARLKTKNNGEDVYHRIGIARFIWTQSQKDDYYRLGDVPPPPDRRGVFYCGPITEDDEKTVAKIL
jgi:predicted ferric reductase